MGGVNIKEGVAERGVSAPFLPSGDQGNKDSFEDRLMNPRIPIQVTAEYEIRFDK
jgi:hypothetical protein